MSDPANRMRIYYSEADRAVIEYDDEGKVCRVTHVEPFDHYAKRGASIVDPEKWQDCSAAIRATDEQVRIYQAKDAARWRYVVDTAIIILVAVGAVVLGIAILHALFAS